MGGELNLQKMGGLRKYMPWTYLTMLLGSFSISGIPGFAGFFSKDEILELLKKVAAAALDRDLPCQASLEAAMACGLGACQGCAVKASSSENRAYYHVCADGPVFPVRAIDWDSL